MILDLSAAPGPRATNDLLRVEVLLLSERAVCICARGEVDVHTAPELDRSLRDALRSQRRCVLDLTEITFFGTAGVRLLDDWQATANSLGIPTAVVLNCRALDTALRLLDSINPVSQFATRQQAVAHVAQARDTAAGLPKAAR